ncbi:FeoC-like transcriptional regulator [Candidatus Parcubacteria bacterium]|nr:hypothetical protein [Patescibacteria group bacterium]MBU4466559.1 hypothetical protein [Patescibacteria group bacterium]MCG2688335.1 FeoC-like transcriptional regulator [Candidatus Parcubacteria bacterium]
MTTELRVLKQILQDDKKASIQLIAKQLEMGNDYIRYLCEELLKKGLVKKLERRDWYEITQKGRERFEEVEELVIKEHSAEKYIPPKKESKKKSKKKAKEVERIEEKPEGETPSADSTPQQTLGQAGSPQAGSGRVREKTRGRIAKKLKRKAKKKIRKEVLKIQKKRIKTPLKLRSRKKRIIKKEKERKIIPLEKQSKKIIKVFKNLFHIKKS